LSKNIYDDESKELLKQIEMEEIKNIKIDNSFSRLDTQKFFNLFINKCSFIGVSSTKAKTKKFTKKDLEDVLNLNDIKSAKEKAERLLTAYVIVQTLKNEYHIEESEIKSYLAKSLRFFANYYIAQNMFDIGKNYLIASLSLKFNEGVLVDYFKVIVEKDIHRNDEMLQFNRYLKQIDIKNNEVKKGLMYLYLFAPSVFEEIEINLNLENEIDAWNKLKDQLTMLKNKNVFLDDIDLDNYTGLFLLDLEFLKELQFIIKSINEYKLENNYSFNEKIAKLNNIENKLNNLKNDTSNKLTLFGAIIYDLCSIISEQVLEEIDKLKISHIAKLTLDSPIDRYSKNEKIEFHLSITNGKNLADAYIKKIELFKDGKLLEKLTPNMRLIGGESKTIPLPLNLVAQETFSVEVKVTFESNEQIYEVIDSFSINVDDQEFIEIDNPYTPDGQIVKNRSMFFGRDELLKKLIEQFRDDKIQALVLYGQKRVGKSTVFHYLEEELSKYFFIVSFSLGTIEDEERFFKKVYLRAKNKLKREYHQEINIDFKPTKEHFIIFLEELKEVLDKKHIQFLLLIDEFTYLYEYIQKNKFKEDFLRFIKSLLQQNLLKIGVIGQNSMPHFINEYPNELAVFKKVKISYLSKKASFDLLEQPILINDKSRYKDDSLEYIYELTNGSPFYLQKIGYEIVEYLNKKRFNYITKAIIEKILNKMFENMSLLGDFDNIISLGNGVDQEVENLRKKAILQIANKSKFFGSVDIDSIELDCSKEKRNEILQSLIDTDVVDVNNNRYSLNVKLLEKYIQRKLGGMI